MPTQTQPTAPNPPAPQAGQPLLPRVIRLFQPYRPQSIIVILTILTTATLGVINPMLIQTVFDDGLGIQTTTGPNLPLLWTLGAIMITIAAINAALGVYQTYMTNKIGQYVMRDLRNAVYAHLQGMSLRFFTATRTGEIQSRVANDIGGIQTVVTTTLSDTIANLAILASTLTAMLIISWQLTIVAIATVPLYFFMAQWVGRKRRQITAATQKSQAEMTVITQETLSVSGIMLTKLFGRQQTELDNFRHHNQQLSDLTIRQQMIGHAFFAIVMAFLSASPVAIYLLAGYLMSGDGPPTVTPGAVIAFTVLQNRLYFPVGRLLQVSVELQSSMAMFDRIFNYLDLTHEITDSPTARPHPPQTITGEITLESVQLTYTPTSSPDDTTTTPHGNPTPAVNPNNNPGAAPQTGSNNNRTAAPPTDSNNNPSAARHTHKNTNPAAAPPTNPAAAPYITPHADLNNITEATPNPPWALNGISLHIPPGQLAAFVGPSGAGKTTIASLIPRLYDVTHGAVRIDGIDVREIPLKDLAQIVGYVTQESYLFHATLEKNLRYARPNATQQEIIAAAQAAHIHDRIMQLPQGYQTIVGERGYRLSGGERQRLSIARAILHQPRILILDEATSSLDTASERTVQTALKPLMQNRTTLIIAHRLSTIISADIIYVINHGQIAEQGTHHQLLTQNGLYTQLYQQQYHNGQIEAHCQDGIINTDGTITPISPR